MVADMYNNRVCVFRPNGEFVSATGEEHGLKKPYDMLECIDGVIVANRNAHNLVKVSTTTTGNVVDVFGGTMGFGEDYSCALAALPDGGFVVQEKENGRFQVFHGLGLRVAWITACVSLARGWRDVI